MKTMTCKQLGGACDLKFQAETFEEMSKLSHTHGTEMFQKGDEAHIKAGQEMKELMQAGKMQEWFAARKEEFDSLPNE